MSYVGYPAVKQSDTLLSCRELFFLRVQEFYIQIVLSGGFVDPEIQGINSQRNFIQFPADESEVFDLVIGDLSVPRDLDQTIGQWVDLIQTGDRLQNNVGKV